MAGKNQVTLTFAGDSKSLDRTLDSVTAGSRKAEDALGKLGDGANRQARSIDRVGESADGAETRFTGLASGIDGVTTLMDDPSPQEFAQGLADISDGIANSAVPAIKGLIDRMGGLKVAAITAGAAIGAAGLVFALKQFNDAADEARGKDLAEEFQKTGQAAEQMEKAAAGDAFAMGDLSNAFGHLLDQSPVLAQEFIDQAEAAGVNEEAIASAQRAVDEAADAEDRLAISLRDVSDAMQAQVDPFFAVIDADRQLRDANQAVAEQLAAVNDAVREHGEQSPEHLAALQGLSDAQIDAASSAYGNDAAIRELAASMQESGKSVDDIISDLQGMADQGKISQGSVDAVSRSLRNVPSRVTSTLEAHDIATRAIDGVDRALSALDGRSATVTVGVVANISAAARWAAEQVNAGFAGGGVVPRYLASGGMGGPRGTDTVPAWLTPGEMVLNKGQQAELWSMANGRGSGGGPAVNVYVSGSVLSERDLVRVVRDELQRGGFRGLVGAR